MLSYCGIGAGNPGFEYRGFVWARSTAALGDELIVRCALVDTSESLLVWTQGVGSLGDISMMYARFSKHTHLSGPASQQIPPHQRKVGE